MVHKILRRVEIIVSVFLGMSFQATIKNENEDTSRPSFSRETSKSVDNEGQKKKAGKESQQPPQPQQGSKQQRGKKGKAKKIREKYKDQDEEEKELRMQLLHQAQKEDGKRAKKKAKEAQMKAEKENKLAKQRARQQREKGQTFQQASAMRAGASDLGQEDDEDAAEDGGKIRISDEVDMIDALTGNNYCLTLKAFKRVHCCTQFEKLHFLS